MNKKLTAWLSILALFLTACGDMSADNITPSPDADLVEAIVQETLAAIETGAAPPGNGNQPSSGTDWLDDVNGQGPPLPAYLAGLFFRSVTDNSLYLVNQNGLAIDTSPVNYDGYAASLSPQTFELVYANNADDGEDLVVFDPGAPDDYLVINSPGILEGGAQWWPANPGIIVFNFMPQEELGPWAGYLGTYDRQTGEYLVLDDQAGSYSTFALSPDGRTIAYDDGGKPIFYLWGQGPQPLDEVRYGIKFESYRAPAWSPDGRQVAYSVSSPHISGEAGTRTAILILDLDNGSAQILHQYDSAGMRGEPHITWSPDGVWLAVVTQGETVGNQSGWALWVLRPDGGEEHLIGFYASSPVWSPDGRYLIYTQWPAPGTGGGAYWNDAHITLVKAGVWQPEEIVQLLGSQIKGWVELP